MKPRKALFLILPLLALAACGGASSAASSEQSQASTDTSKSEEAVDDSIREIYGLYVKNEQAKGKTPLSYEEWLASIKGEKGDVGPQGPKGDKGEDGKSAYELYIAAHPDYAGSETEWLSALVSGKIIETHTVTFDLGHDNLTFTQEVVDGRKVVRPQDPTWDGHGFYGWYYPGSLDKWVFEGFPVTEDMALTAKWYLKTYDVTFKNNDGSVVYSNMYDYGTAKAQVVADCESKARTPVAVNQDPLYDYEFIGWDGPDTIAGDTTYTAQYKTTYSAKTAYYYGEDGTTFLWSKTFSKYEPIAYGGTLPTKEADTAHGIHYEFSSWEVMSEGANEIRYKAVFSAAEDGLTIQNGVVKAYDGKAKALTIPTVYAGSTVTAIAEEAFQGNAALESVTLPSFLQTIGRSAFAGCSKLKSITLPTTVGTIGASAFQDCTALESVVFNTEEVPTPAGPEVPDVAYVKVFAPSSYTRIWAWKGETNLFGSWPGERLNVFDSEWNTYDFPDYTSLSVIVSKNGSGQSADFTADQPGNWWYNGAKWVRSNTAPAMEEPKRLDVGPYAFAQCSALKAIALPDYTYSIGECAFARCSALETVSIPDGVFLFYNNAFTGCQKLAFAVVSGAKYLGTTENPYLWLVEAEDSAITSCAIQDGCRHILREAFFARQSLIWISIPDSVVTIGEGAFYNCSSLAAVFCWDCRITYQTFESVGIATSELYWYSETKPTSVSYKTWHYVDGEPTPWGV